MRLLKGHHIDHYLLLIIAATAAIVPMWQTTRTTPLIDYSYQVENAYRIFQGQMPYRDFFLVLAPGTYYILAFLMFLTQGYTHTMMVVYVLIISYVLIFITYHLLSRITTIRHLAIIALLPIIFAGHSLYPYPIYDMNAVCIMLGIIAFHTSFEKKFRSNSFYYFFLGNFIALPIFMKQNIGYVFVVSCTSSILLDIWTTRSNKYILSSLLLIFGIMTPILFFAYYLVVNGILHSFIYQTLIFPSYAKNLHQQLSIILAQYSLAFGYMYMYRFPILISIASVGVLDWIGSRVANQKINLRMTYIYTCLSFFLISWMLYKAYISVPFEHLYRTSILLLWTVISLLSFFLCVFRFLSNIKSKKPIRTFSLLPLIFIPPALATYLAHDVVGSSYSTWPIVMILLVYTVQECKRIFNFIQWDIIVIPIVLFFIGILYQAVITNNFLHYYLAFGPVYHSRYKAITGLSTPGPWIANMEAMFDFVEKHIPKNESVVFLPGEDPFFAVTKRINPLPFVQLHYQTYPMDYNSIILTILDKQVDWIIVKRQLQVFQNLGLADPVYIIEGVSPYYTLAHTIVGYEMYSRIK